MQTLIDQEVALHHYDVCQDRSVVSRLLHPDFKEVGESGNSYDFTSINELMKTEKPSRGFLHSQDYECVVLGTNTQMLLYKTAWNDGLGHVRHYAKRSSIWVFNGSHWQMQYHQGTACSPFKLAENISARRNELSPA
ncbi:nuclear transport factor 2 family protein [Vibrio paucivorans]|uniref:DUF4440 domain-containing protein n=1 Tax=Vibrio paucivorans TaxID=2829489 RepID=A0A9X3CE78_9VIBR|nr:DUF4440 domain-containing protein [Vibrio paucivorans]MCW8334148.1 DUF4440 domain-containing protein [Vibrio paucivorans]